MFEEKKILSKGVTLIEFILVIFIIGLVSTVTLLNYRGFGKEFNLERSSQRLAQEVRKTLEMSTSAESLNGDPGFKGGYGLHFFSIGENNVSYIIFVDNNDDKNYDLGDSTIRTVELEAGVEIWTISADGSPMSPLSIVFFPPDPKIYIGGKTGEQSTYSEAIIILRLKNDTSKQKSVTVNKVGLIEIE